MQVFVGVALAPLFGLEHAVHVAAVDQGRQFVDRCQHPDRGERFGQFLLLVFQARAQLAHLPAQERRRHQRAGQIAEGDRFGHRAGSAAGRWACIHHIVAPMPRSAVADNISVWRGRSANMQNTMITMVMVSMAARSGPLMA